MSFAALPSAGSPGVNARRAGALCWYTGHVRLNNHLRAIASSIAVFMERINSVPQLLAATRSFRSFQHHPTIKCSLSTVICLTDSLASAV